MDGLSGSLGSETSANDVWLVKWTEGRTYQWSETSAAGDVWLVKRTEGRKVCYAQMLRSTPPRGADWKFEVVLTVTLTARVSTKLGLS